MKTLSITLIVAFVCLALPQPALASSSPSVLEAVQAKHPGFDLIMEADGKGVHIALFQKSEIIALAILEEQDGNLKLIEWNEHLLPLKQYREEQFQLLVHDDLENLCMPTFTYYEQDTDYMLYLGFEKQGERWMLGGALNYKDEEKNIEFFLSENGQDIIYRNGYPYIRTKKPQSMYLSEFSLPALQKHMQPYVKLRSAFLELGCREDTCILYEDIDYYEGEEPLSD